MSGFKYRRDIDGLRAISVLLVILFHAGGIVSGGYVGVDVFFVISGFLITSIIQTEVSNGTFSMRRFWARRVRRILPASIACIALTILFSAIVMLPDDFICVAESAAACCVAAGNVFFWRYGGYFAGPSETMPFLHFWSLAVEEQFYLFYPFLLYGLSKARRISTLKCLCLLAFASFILSVLSVQFKPTAGFYLLPFRAWELLIGGILATIPVSDCKEIYRQSSSLLGLCLILVPAFLYTSHTPFPGFAALVPCLGAFALIWANRGETQTLVGRLFELKALVFIGIISYSLYLWHWPVLALARYAFIEINLVSGCCAIVVSFLMAVVSWAFIEQKFRSRKSSPPSTTRNTPVFAWGAVATLCALLLSLFISYSDGLPWRFRESLTPHLENAQWSGREIQTLDAETKFPRVGDLDTPIDSFVVWGDSHAMMMSEVIAQAAKQSRIAGRFISVPGAPPLPRVWRQHGTKPPSKRSAKIIEYLQKGSIKNVILVARWSAYAEGYTDGDLLFEERGKKSTAFIIGDEKTKQYCKEDGRRVLRSQLKQLSKTLAKAGITLWLLQQVPEQLGPTAMPYLLEKHISLPASYSPATYQQYLARHGATLEILNSLKQFGAQVIETEDLIFPTEESPPILFRDGQACFKDNDHLTRFGASALLRDRWNSVMNTIRDRQFLIEQPTPQQAIKQSHSAFAPQLEK